MPYDLEPFEGNGLVPADARLLTRYRYLLLNGIDSVEIRQQQPALSSAADYNIELV